MDNLEFPRILYRSGTAWSLEAGQFDLLEVASAEALEAAQADGWHLDQYAAKEAHEAAQAQPVAPVEQAAAIDAAQPAEPVDDTSAPTRAELEQKATELGIKFDARWGDKKLAAAIDAAVKA
jgi:hypothetical protein